MTGKRQTKVLVVLAALAGLLGACADGDDPREAALSKYPNPARAGCAITPTVAERHAGGAEYGSCPIGVWFPLASRFQQPLDVIVEAAQSQSPLDRCVVVGTSQVDTLSTYEVPAGCEFQYTATIGTVSSTHQVVDYDVAIEADDTCWPVSCTHTFRVEYRNLGITPR